MRRTRKRYLSSRETCESQFQLLGQGPCQACSNFKGAEHIQWSTIAVSGEVKSRHSPIKGTGLVLTGRKWVMGYWNRPFCPWRSPAWERKHGEKPIGERVSTTRPCELPNTSRRVQVVQPLRDAGIGAYPDGFAKHRDLNRRCPATSGGATCARSPAQDTCLLVARCAAVSQLS